MPYATATKYLQRFGFEEGRQLLADEQNLLTAQLLKDVLAGTWTGTPSAEEQAAATDAKDRLEHQLTIQSNFMDGYLRSVATLPLPADSADAGTLEECCLSLTRAGIADDCDNATDRIDAAAKQWRDWLRDVQRGNVQLVGTSGEAAPSGGRVRSGQAKSALPWPLYGGVQ